MLESMTREEAEAFCERINSGNPVLVANGDIEFFEYILKGKGINFTQEHGWFSTLFRKA